MTEFTPLIEAFGWVGALLILAAYILIDRPAGRQVARVSLDERRGGGGVRRQQRLEWRVAFGCAQYRLDGHWIPDIMADTQIDPPDRLIFIYNADGGIAQGIMDSVHKTLSPSTYPCSLCAITYGAFTMDRRWRAWLKALPVPSVFYHKDDSPYREVALPVVLIERGGQVATLVSAEQLDSLASVDALIAEIEARL